MTVAALLFATAAMASGTVAELHIPPPATSAFVFTSNDGPMALSHDGRQLAFIATMAGTNVIWLRSLSSGTARPIVETTGAQYPFWSADDRFLGFFADGKLKTISLSGGSPQVLCDAPRPRGGTWNAAGTILFAGPHDGLQQISASGGGVTSATRLQKGEYSHRFPWFLADGRHFLYLSQSSTGFRDSRIFVGCLDTDERSSLVPANAPAISSSRGDLFFLRGRTLMVQRFDAKRLRVVGEARPVADDIQYFPNTASAMFTVADDGTLAFHRGRGRMSRLVWVDLSGKQVATSRVSGNTQLPRTSHRGDRIVYSLADPVTGEGDLWILDVARDESTRFTNEAGDELWEAWSPDDSEIAYSEGRGGSYDILVRSSIRPGPPRVLYSSRAAKFVNDWSRDGRWILFQQIEPQTATGWDIWVLDLKTKTAAPLTQTRFNEEGAALSPDGKWMAYSSDATGRMELYVQSFRAPGLSRQITTAGGSEPQWSDHGNAIYFRDGHDNLCRVEVSTAPDVRVSGLKVLFPLRARWLDVGGRHWEVTHGRVLQDVLIPEEAPAPITILRR